MSLKLFAVSFFVVPYAYAGYHALIGWGAATPVESFAMMGIVGLMGERVMWWLLANKDR